MLKTKRQLRGERRFALDRWLRERGTKLDEASFWSDGFRDAEQAEFAALDSAYESAKTASAEELKTMGEADVEEWFAEIRWVPVGATVEERVDDYFARA